MVQTPIAWYEAARWISLGGSTDYFDTSAHSSRLQWGNSVAIGVFPNTSENRWTQSNSIKSLADSFQMYTLNSSNLHGIHTSKPSLVTERICAIQTLTHPIRWCYHMIFCKWLQKESVLLQICNSFSISNFDLLFLLSLLHVSICYSSLHLRLSLLALSLVS